MMETLDRIAFYINSLDYVLIGNLTTLSVFVYLVAGLLMKIEHRIRGERLVPIEDYQAFMEWKKRRECDGEA